MDDQGKAFDISPDPLLPRLQEALAGIELGKPETAEGKLDALLADPVLFGSDLLGTGLDDAVQADFSALLAGPGAVRRVLHTTLS